jgi:hypothetical protein
MDFNPHFIRSSLPYLRLGGSDKIKPLALFNKLQHPIKSLHMMTNATHQTLCFCLLFSLQVLLPVKILAQDAVSIAFGENLMYSLNTTASDTAFSSPVVGPGDVLFFKIDSDGLQVKVELFAPGAATPDTTISGSFNDDIELIYPIPAGHPTGAYILLVSNIGIWTGDDCITLQRMNEPPTALHLECEATKDGNLACDSDVRAFKYLVEANTLSRIVVNGGFAPEVWVCAPDGSIIQYGAEGFNEQLILDSIPATETTCYYVFVSDDAAQWAGDFSISYTTILGECASVVLESNADTNEYCEGDTLMLSATSILDNTTYIWSGPNDFVSTDDTIYIYGLTPGQAGLYEVTASSPGVCDSKAARNIIVHALPEVTALSEEDGALCDGESLSLSVVTNASSPKTCYWEGPNFTSTACLASIFTADVEDSGTYTIWVTDSKGCTNTDEVEVIVNPLPMAVISSPADGQVCTGETLVLNVTTDVDEASYEWTGPNGFMSTLKMPSIEDVTSVYQDYYYVTVTNNITGCEGQGFDFINVRPVPSGFITGDTVICQGESTELFAFPSSGVSYEWNTGDEARIITVNPVATTTYTVTVTNTYTCKDVASVEVVVNALPTLEVSPEIAEIKACESGEIATLCLTSNAQNPQYSWAVDGIGMEGQCIFVEYEPSSSAQYVGVVEDGITGCMSNTITVPVTIVALPNVEILANPDIQLCDGAGFTLCAESDATNPTYEWIGPNNFMSNVICAAQNDVANDDSGAYEVTVTSNTLGLQCSSTNSVILEIGMPLQCDLEVLSDSIQAIASGGFPPYTYTLMPGGQMNTTGLFENVSDGSYYIDLMDDNGCEFTSSEIAVVGTSSLIAESGIKVFPNPSDGLVHIYCTKLPEEDMQVSILDVSGQNVQTFPLKDKQQTIDLSGLPAGVYWLRLADTRRAEAIKLVLTR